MVNKRPSFERTKTVTSDYTLNVNDNTIVIDASSNIVNITFPLASESNYKYLLFIADNTNAINLVATGWNTVPSIDAINGKSYTFQSDGVSAWKIVDTKMVFWDVAWTAVEGDDSRLIFGNEYQYVADASISTTTSTTFQNKLTLVTSNLPLANYRIAVNYWWNHDATTNDFEARVQLNAVNLGQIHKQEPKDSAWGDPTGTTQRYLATRIYEPQNLSGVQTITLDYRTDNAGVESSIWDSHLEIFRVS